MLRFVSAYRWELWLVIGFPVVAGMVAWGALVGIGSVVGEDDRQKVVVASILLGTITASALLVLFNDRARRQGRDLLALLWGYSLWVAMVGMLTLSVILLLHTASPPGGESTQKLTTATQWSPPMRLAPVNEAEGRTDWRAWAAGILAELKDEISIDLLSKFRDWLFDMIRDWVSSLTRLIGQGSTP